MLDWFAVPPRHPKPPKHKYDDIDNGGEKVFVEVIEQPLVEGRQPEQPENASEVGQVNDQEPYGYEPKYPFATTTIGQHEGQEHDHHIQAVAAFKDIQHFPGALEDKHRGTVRVRILGCVCAEER